MPLWRRVTFLRRRRMARALALRREPIVRDVVKLRRGIREAGRAMVEFQMSVAQTELSLIRAELAGVFDEPLDK